MRKLIAAAALVALTACNAAVTAYNRDRTKSWMCVPNTTVQPPLREQPTLSITEPDEKVPEKVAAKK